MRSTLLLQLHNNNTAHLKIMLQKVLKEATNAKHTQLEALMHVDKIMYGTLTPEEYRQILTINYKVHQVIE